MHELGTASQCPFTGYGLSLGRHIGLCRQPWGYAMYNMSIMLKLAASCTEAHLTHAGVSTWPHQLKLKLHRDLPNCRHSRPYRNIQNKLL